MNKNRVIAVVNGKEITEASIVEFMRSLGPEKSKQFNSEDGMKKVIIEVINQELLYADAIDKGYDEEEAFLKKLDITEEEMLKQYAIYKIISAVDISDDELKDYYKENKNNFFREEMFRASHILIDTEDKANEILEELNNGLSFEEAAEKYSLCPSKQNGGDLGFFPKGKMVKEFEDVIFSLEIDKISTPVKTQFGYHIIKATDRKEAGILLFDEIKDNLKQELLRSKQTYFYNQKINELKAKYKVEIKLGDSSENKDTSN